MSEVDDDPDAVAALVAGVAPGDTSGAGRGPTPTKRGVGAPKGNTNAQVGRDNLESPSERKERRRLDRESAKRDRNGMLAALNLQGDAFARVAGNLYVEVRANLARFLRASTAHKARDTDKAGGPAAALRASTNAAADVCTLLERLLKRYAELRPPDSRSVGNSMPTRSVFLIAGVDPADPNHCPSCHAVLEYELPMASTGNAVPPILTERDASAEGPRVSLDPFFLAPVFSDTAHPPLCDCPACRAN